jgi:serine/threonine-protein kinase HipA
MKRADVYVHGIRAGVLEEISKGKEYAFQYAPDYSGPPVSLTMPIRKGRFRFDRFPPFFEGLLPEGISLEAMLKANKIDKDDYFEQLLSLGKDLVGAVTVEP